MASMIDEIKIAYWDYHAYGFPVIIGLVALGCLLAGLEKGRRENQSLTGYGILCWIMLMLPGLCNVLLGLRADSGDTWLWYGIGGAWVFAAYVIAEYWSSRPTRKSKVMAVLLVLVLFQTGIAFDYSTDGLEFLQNPYKVSSETIEVADALADIHEPVLLAPESLAEQIREYNSDIRTYYGGEFMYTPSIPEHLMIEASTYGCNVVVVEKQYATEEALAYYESKGYYPFYESENYLVCVEQLFAIDTLFGGNN